MKIVSIELENFGPFVGRHLFRFEDRGLTLVMGDNQDEPMMNSNGAGKSSIFDALDWGLFGRVPRGDHADSICNDDSSSVAVEVILARDDGVPMRVYRGRSKTNFLEFMVGDRSLTALDKDETQKLIERELGLDRTVFHAAVLFGQTDLAHYADSTDSERMKVLTHILQLDEIDVFLERAKAEVQKSKALELNANTQLASTEGALGNLKSQDYTANIAAWAETQARELNELHGLRQQRVTTLAGRESQVAQLPGIDSQIVALDTALKATPYPQDVGLQEARAEQQKMRSLVSTLGAEITRIRKGITTYRSRSTGICSECGQTVTQEHLAVEVGRMETQAASVAFDLTEARKVLGSWDANVAMLNDAYKQAVVDYSGVTRDQTGELGRLRQVRTQLVMEQNQIAVDRRELQRLDASLLQRQNAVNPWVEQKTQCEKQIAEHLTTISKLADTKQQIETELKYLEFWVEGFGPRGLKSYILDSKLQALSDAANRWVKLLTGGTIWVRFESQKQTRGKKIVNSPDIRVCRHNPDGSVTERNYKSWSGGEKQRISFAIDFGLSRLIADRAKHRYDILILDEVFRHLDQAGKEAVVEMLKLLAQEKNSVFVVEHDTDFQSSFEHRVLVQKKGGKSEIKELTDEWQKQKTKSVQTLSVPAGIDRKPRRAGHSPVRTPVLTGG